MLNKDKMVSCQAHGSTNRVDKEFNIIKLVTIADIPTFLSFLEGDLFG